ncbi:MAG: hypothetical protein WAZ48_14475 [Lysobacteraceae bacterium]
MIENPFIPNQFRQGFERSVLLPAFHAHSCALSIHISKKRHLPGIDKRALKSPIESSKTIEKKPSESAYFFANQTPFQGAEAAFER